MKWNFYSRLMKAKLIWEWIEWNRQKNPTVSKQTSEKVTRTSGCLLCILVFVSDLIIKQKIQVHIIIIIDIIDERNLKSSVNQISFFFKWHLLNSCQNKFVSEADLPSFPLTNTINSDDFQYLQRRNSRASIKIASEV